MDNKWQGIKEKVIYRRDFVKFKEELYQHQEKGIKHSFFRMEFLDWVNIVPITFQQEVVLVKQYRFGTEEVTLEVPGGTLDQGEDNPRLAAKRELREETGYQATEIIDLGKVAANPAIQNNYCYFYLAEGAKQVQKQDLDLTEDIELILVPIEEIDSLIGSGNIDHSLAVLALLYAQRYYLD
ncbi:NUDIX hydrolase [Halanaerocella petrolearia]